MQIEKNKPNMIKKIKLTITGMHCASCAANVERAIKRVKGVKNISASVLTHRAVLEAEDDANINEIKNVISKLGYNVIKIE